MRTSLLAAAVALGAAVPVLAPAAPANAAGAWVCTFHYDSVTGSSNGTGTCTGSSGLVQMVFTAESACPTHTASGAMNVGPGIKQFSWTRVGNAGVIRLISGAVGTMVFSSTCPADGETAVVTLAP